MKDEEFKNLWNMIHDKGSDHTPGISPELSISNRSASIRDKLRKMLQNDMILKAVSLIAIILNILFYRNTPDVIFICLGCLLFLVLMTTIEWKTLQGFIRIADPGKATRDVLSSVLIYLKRKSNLYELSIASSQVLIFVPGLLLYFYLAYGQVRPMDGFSFFVFATLALIGTFTSFTRTKSQIIFHLKHISVCLADLNENTMEMALETIDKQRRKDNLIKTMVGLLLILGFVILVGVLKTTLG